jgi:hypothetical protein
MPRHWISSGAKDGTFPHRADAADNSRSHELM